MKTFIEFIKSEHPELLDEGWKSNLMGLATAGLMGLSGISGAKGQETTSQPQITWIDAKGNTIKAEKYQYLNKMFKNALEHFKFKININQSKDPKKWNYVNISITSEYDPTNTLKFDSNVVDQPSVIMNSIKNMLNDLTKGESKEAIKTPAGTLRDPKTGDIKGGVKSGPSIPYSPPFKIGPSDASGPRYLR